MVGVGIGTLAAVIAGIVTAMLRSGIILPRAIAVGAVDCAIVHQCITAIAILIPVTCGDPCSAGIVVVTDGGSFGFFIPTATTSVRIAAGCTVITGESVALHFEAESCITGSTHDLLLMLCSGGRFIVIIPITAGTAATC